MTKAICSVMALLAIAMASENSPQVARRPRALRPTAGSIPEYPTGTTLMMVSPHSRNDPSPQYGQANYGSNQATGKISSAVGKGTLGSKVAAYFDGQGVWQRYEINALPSFVDVRTTSTAASIFKAAETSAGPSTAQCGEGKTCINNIPVAPLNTSSQSKAIADANAIMEKSGGIDNCENDVYAPVPLGWSSNVSFHTGLNQLWIVLKPKRTDVLTWVAVGADASGKTAVFYVGSGDGKVYDTTMYTLFNQFSSPLNPLHFQIDYESTGLPRLSMTIGHYQDQQIYGWYDLYFTPPTEWNANQTKFVHSWTHSWNPEFRQDELSIQKALQIWNLCNCYQFTPSDVLHCLGVSSKGSSSFWFRLEAMIATALLDEAAKERMITNELMAWKVPPKTYVDNKWQYCWQDANVTTTLDANAGARRLRVKPGFMI